MTICIAQAHQSAGDYGAARAELESLLSQDTRDTELLQQLSKLCEQGSDSEAAITYQRQLVSIAPAHETEYRLSGLLQANGDVEEATEILVRLTRREEDPARLLRSLDALLNAGSFEAALAVTEPLLRERRDDWELLYREGVAWASLEKKAEAATRFQQILSLSAPHDTPGVRAADRLKQQLAKAKSNNLMGIRTTLPTRPSPLQATQYASTVRQAVGIDFQNYYYSQQSAIWAPDNVAQARMAAIGWQLNFAQAAGQEEAFIAEFTKRSAAEEAPRENLLDLLYLQSLRNKYDEVFAIAKRLARRGGLEEQRFFLESLNNRGYDPLAARSSRNGGTKAPPLADDEIELMLACHTSVMKHDAQASNPQNPTVRSQVSIDGYVQQVSKELRLAGRVAAADALIAEKLQQAANFSQVLSAMRLCLADEALDKLDPLFERWKTSAREEVASRAGTAAGNSRQPPNTPLDESAQLLGQWMGLLGEQRKNDAALAIYDGAIDIGIEAARERRAGKPSGRLRPRQGNSYFAIWYGKQQQYSQLAWPEANAHVDQSMLQMLRQTFEVFERNDVRSDLLTHLKQRAETASADDRLYHTLLYGYTLWWQEGRHDEAIEVITRAADLLPDDPQFRLELAGLHEAHGDFATALEIVDSVAPRDQALLQLRETMALQIAQRLGDIDRARAAAERLFGLRLDADSQLALAGHMRSLGLQDMAQAIVSRMRRRSGNTPSALVTLMTQYQGEGRLDLAEQLALVLLQRVPRPNAAMASMIARGRMSSGDFNTRQQALRLVVQTGGIKKLVERAESQLALSPKSSPLYEQLIELYGAADNRDKVEELLKLAIQQRPDSLELRQMMASKLEAAGKYSEACDQYLVVIKERPELVSNDFYQVQNLFQRAERLGDLGKALSTMNFKRFRQPYYILNLVSTLLQNEPTRVQGVALFERCFNEIPAYRGQLVSNLYDPEMFKETRIFELASRCLIPSDAQVVSQPWYGFDQVNSYSGNGQAIGTIDRLLTGARGTDLSGRLRQLTRERLDTAPGWLGGRAILAVLDISTGNKDAGRQALQQLFPDDISLESAPQAALWLIGQQLDQSEATRDLAIKLLEAAARKYDNENDFQYSPAMRLVSLYQKRGDKERARELLLQGLKPRRNDYSDGNYRAYQQLQAEFSIAAALLQNNYPIDSLRVYRNLVNHPEKIDRASTVYSNAAQQAQQYRTQASDGLTQALAHLKSTNLDAAITQLLAPDQDAADGTQQIDLLLIIPEESRATSQTMQCPLAKVLSLALKDDKLRAGVEQQLSRLQQAHPDDLSVSILSALWSARQEGESFKQKVALLQALVRKSPHEELPPGVRPNSRQRAAAARAIGVWLVARECLRVPETREAGEELATHALTGASRQLDRNATVSILIEWGKLALDAGDRDGAEQRWTQLLEAVTIRPRSERAKPPADKPQQPARPVTPAVPKAASAVPARARPPETVLALAQAKEPVAKAAAGDTTVRLPPLTMPQFRLAMQIAKLAAANKLPKLSQRAVREALAGGLPAPEISQNEEMGGRRSLSSGRAVPSHGLGVEDDGADTQQEVAVAIREVTQLWPADTYPPADLYAIFEPVVFPALRSGDILLFADSSTLAQGQAASLGADLVGWAAAAGRIPDLQRQIAARRENGSARIPALILDVELALRAGDMPAATTALKELETLAAAAPPALGLLAGHAAVHAFERDELKSAAVPLLTRVIKGTTEVSEEDYYGRASTSELGRLATKVGKYLVRSENLAGLEDFYDSYAESRRQRFARYSGDYGAYMLSLDWTAIANHAAQVGATHIALDYSGRVADAYGSFKDYGKPDLSQALALVAVDLQSRPALERYTMWRDWTFPESRGDTFRVLVELTQAPNTPEVFLALAPGRKPADFAPLRGADLLSNLTLLVGAAHEAGKLQELRQLILPRHEKKVLFADTLLALVLVRAGEAAAAQPVIEQMIAAGEKRTEKLQPNVSALVTQADGILWHAALGQPELAALVLARFPELQRVSRARSEGNGVANSSPHSRGPDFRHWFVATDPASETPRQFPWWTLSENQIVHLDSSGTLFLKYPLSGTFEMSAETSRAPASSAMLGFGGIMMSGDGHDLNFGGATGHASHAISGPAARDETAFDLTVVRVSEGKQTIHLNGYDVYREKLAGTSPWLQLSAAVSANAFRNLRFQGEPTIPREVRLFQDKFMEGWNTSFFDESQPILQRAEGVTTSPVSTEEVHDLPEDESDSETPPEFDWKVAEGILTGRARKSEVPHAAGWTWYHRPLLPDERFACEFFYEPGKTGTHPTFGRLAFLLEPAGIRTRYIVEPAWENGVLGIPFDNALDEVPFRRGDGPLPLKAGDWNSLTIALKGDSVVLELNGTLVFERPVDSASSRCFGFYHPLSLETRVRNAVLTGPWPEKFTLEIQRDLLALTAVPSATDRTLASGILGDHIAAARALEVVAKARGQADPAAFDTLKTWVLPSDEHADTRLFFARAPLVPVEPTPPGTATFQPAEHVSPVEELFQVAKRLGRLDEVAKLVETLPVKTPADTAKRLALQVLLATARDDDTAAKSHLAALRAARLDKLSDARQVWHLAPEVLAITAASRRPALNEEARAFAVALRDLGRKDEETASSVLSLLEALVGETERLAAATTAPSALLQWHVVPIETAKSRSAGLVAGQWLGEPGALRYRAGEAPAQLWFQSPLEGKFEIQARVTTGKRDALLLGFGHVAAQPEAPDFKTTMLHRLLRGETPVGDSITIPNPGQTLLYRLSIDEGTLTTHVNDVKIHERRFSPRPAPWLVLAPRQPGAMGRIDDLRIVGNPKAPESVNLLEDTTLAAWRSNYYSEHLLLDVDVSQTGEGEHVSTTWSLSGSELLGSSQTNIGLMPPESLLFYQRPLLEDGEIEFESYYVPKEYEIHPAIGRTALLIGPDGVQRHTLTDLPFETPRLSPDNQERIAGSPEKVVLKEKDWNHIRVVIKGDSATLFVNTAEVASVALPDRPDRRFFGLFRFSSGQQCRVKNIILRGGWPKTVPPVKEQELAAP